MWQWFGYIWYRYFRRRKISRPGDKLDGSSASDPISFQDIDKGSTSLAFTWSNGFPVAKARKKYWIVLKLEHPAQEADGKYEAIKFAPSKAGKIESAQIGYRQIGEGLGSISAEIWTNVDDPLTWEQYSEETKCKTPNS